MRENNTSGPGRFIVIEGIDGAGTTTQARQLVEWLAARGRNGVLTCEPSRGPVGELLRKIMSGKVRAMGNDAIALLFAADRIDHLQSEVLPAIDAGKDVVSDRYYHSSFTYQSLQGDLEWIRTINEHARTPDVTYVLHLPWDQAESRRKQVRSSEEMYEKEDTQRKLEKAYQSLPSLLPDQIVVIVDGSANISTVQQAIVEDLTSRFPDLCGP